MKFGIRKAKHLQLVFQTEQSRTHFPVPRLVLRHHDQTLLFQFVSGQLEVKAIFQLLFKLKVNERQGDCCRVFLTAVHPAVQFELGPVQLPLIVGDGIHIAIKRLYFFETAVTLTETVGASPHQQAVDEQIQSDFRPIALGTFAIDLLVPFGTLQAGGGGRKAALDATGASCKGCEGPHRYGGHGRDGQVSKHDTHWPESRVGRNIRASAAGYPAACHRAPLLR